MLKKFFLQSLKLIEKFAKILKIKLYSNIRYKKLSKRKNLRNNYSHFMIDRIKKIGIVAEHEYDRKLFLENFVLNIKYHIDHDKACLNILDWGGGIGSQSFYINKKYPNQFKLSIIEQNEIIKYINNKSFKKTFANNNITFKDDLIINNTSFDATMFNGSLSYLDRGLEILKENNLGEIIGVSRLPVSENIDEKIMVLDTFGNHQEYIHSKNKLDEILKNFEILFYSLSYETDTKRNMFGLYIQSANFIVKRTL
tara:strand:- start:455 stop:1216 length:762 start_codon:yes stop_codon:yes gene_type:complete